MAAAHAGMQDEPVTQAPHEWTVPPSDVLLADGTIGVIRRVTSEDRDAVLALHEGVSQDTLRLRFFTSSPVAGSQYVAHLFDPANTRSVVLLAVVGGRVAGLATAELLGDDRAEVAFLVSDDDRGRGLGSLLLERCSPWADPHHQRPRIVRADKGKDRHGARRRHHEEEPCRASRRT